MIEKVGVVVVVKHPGTGKQTNKICNYERHNIITIKAHNTWHNV